MLLPVLTGLTSARVPERLILLMTRLTLAELWTTNLRRITIWQTLAQARQNTDKLQATAQQTRQEILRLCL